MSVDVRCPTESDTRAIGRRLASLLRAGDVILLSGDLGAGKTVFASGIAEGLGVEDPVVSPSFVLARRYRGLMDMVHADLYRLGSLAEVEDLDMEADAAEGVLVVEWGDAAEQRLPADHLLVRIEIGDDEARSIRFETHGSWTSRPIGEVAE